MRACAADVWREKYDEWTYHEHVNFYEGVWRDRPDQKRYDIESVLRFLLRAREDFCMHPEPMAVLEIGGWDGALARDVFGSSPDVHSWINVEICRSAAVASVCHHPGYQALLLNDFAWSKSVFLPLPDALVMSHVVEHMRLRDFCGLLDNLADWDGLSVYLQAPLGPDGTDWRGYRGTHILECGWEGLEGVLTDRGWTPINHLCGIENPQVRTYGRAVR